MFYYGESYKIWIVWSSSTVEIIDCSEWERGDGEGIMYIVNLQKKKKHEFNLGVLIIIHVFIFSFTLNWVSYMRNYID